MGLNPLSMSTPIRDQGSALNADGTSLAFRGSTRMWPIEDWTTKSRPSIPAIVFALAGDSTMTRGFGTGGRTGSLGGPWQAAGRRGRAVRARFVLNARTLDGSRPRDVPAS